MAKHGDQRNLVKELKSDLQKRPYSVGTRCVCDIPNTLSSFVQRYVERFDLLYNEIISTNDANIEKTIAEIIEFLQLDMLGVLYAITLIELFGMFH